jgi:Na+/H+-dicarboxylate symporter
MTRLFGVLLAGAMIVGVLVGWACNVLLAPDQIETVTGWFTIATDLFLRLIKMVIAPLVFSTLVAGLARMESAASIGRIGAKTMAWFIAASVVSLTLGMVMVQWVQPGAGLGLADTLPAGAAPAVDVSTFTLKDFITHLVPRSIVEAMANNEILQIVVFSLFVGTAVAALQGRSPVVIDLVDQVAEIMLKVTGYVMRVAPLAVFAALASTVAQQGLDVLLTYAKFVGGFYLSLAILWLLLWAAAHVAIGSRALGLFQAVRGPILLGFATASSEATYPRTLEALEGFGLPRRIASFVLPLGYSFNLDGSMMYCAFATLFIAQAYGVELGFGQQLTLMLLLLVTSKGMAGVPRASLVVMAATLTYFGLPESGLLLILAVDQLLDMGRTATNVLGNSVATAVVARWEGQAPGPLRGPG